MKREDRIANRDGFTLLECLISLFLIALILYGGMEVIFLSDRFMSLSVHKNLALEIAMSRMEEVRGLGYAGLPEEGSPLTNTVPLGGLTAQETITVFDKDEDADNFVDYKEVVLSLQWQESLSSLDKDVSLTTYIAP